MADEIQKEINNCNNSMAKYEKNIRKWKRMIENAEKAITYNKDKIKHVQGLEYYVYVVFVDGEPRYVGKGKKDRYKHPVSGSSSCAELNRDYFQNKYIEVLFAERFLTEQKALEAEQNWIGQMNEYYWGEDKLYNKEIPNKFHYMDECAEYFYYSWFTHAIDNSSNDGVKIVKPENKGSVWSNTKHHLMEE